MKEKTSLIDKFSTVFTVAWVLLLVSLLAYKFWFIESMIDNTKETAAITELKNRITALEKIIIKNDKRTTTKKGGE